MSFNVKSLVDVEKTGSCERQYRNNCPR